MIYNITIEETYAITVPIEANSSYEAKEKIRELYDSGKLDKDLKNNLNSSEITDFESLGKKHEIYGICCG